MSQWDMMQGGMPEEGLEEGLFICYVIFFHLIVFFLLINFLLAIVVEAFLKCKQVANDDETEKSFPADVALTIQSYIMAARNRWPRRLVLVHKMQELKTHRIIDTMLVNMFPNWSVQSRESFFKYYLGYEFCRLKPRQARMMGMSVHQAVDEIECRMKKLFWQYMEQKPKPQPEPQQAISGELMAHPNSADLFGDEAEATPARSWWQ